MHKRHRSASTSPRPHKRPRIDVPPLLSLFLDLPGEMRDEIRAWLDHEARIDLQGVCWRLYHEDPGFIPPAYLTEVQTRLEQALAPMNIFDVASFEYGKRYVETGNIIRYGLSAIMPGAVEIPISAKTTTNTDVARTAAGLELPRNFMQDKYTDRDGNVDRDIILSTLQEQEYYELKDNGWYDNGSDNSDFNSEEERRAIEITEDRIDAKEQRQIEKTNERRIIMLYAAMRQEQRRIWKERHTKV